MLLLSLSTYLNKLPLNKSKILIGTAIRAINQRRLTKY